MATNLLSSDQCIKQSFNPDVQALEVKVKDTAMSLSLNHKEDSVVSVAMTVSQEIKKDETASVAGLKQISVFAPVGTVVKASPVNDADVWATVGTVSETGVLTLNMCALRLTINNDGHIVGV